MKSGFVVFSATTMVLLIVAGCSSSGSTNRPATTRPSTPFSFHNTPDTTHVYTVTSSPTPSPRLDSTDAAFVSLVQPLLHESAADTIRTGHLFCRALRVRHSFADAETAGADLGLSKKQLDKVINYSALSYCMKEFGDELKALSNKVTYRITGNGSESGVITYTVGGDDIEQDTSASLPWQKKIRPGGDLYQLSAQDDDGTRITCEIIDTDGTVLDKRTAHGEYAIASCQSTG